MRLVSVVTSTRSPRATRSRICAIRSSTWPFDRLDLDLGIDQPGRADDLLAPPAALCCSSYGPGVALT